MLHFQIPHLLRYMKTAHRIPRHETSSMHKFPFPFYLSSPFMATFRRAEYLYITKKRGKRAPTETKATRTNKLTRSKSKEIEQKSCYKDQDVI